MNIAILGTGTVARHLAGALSSLTHAVVLGTREPATTRDRAAFAEWSAANPGVDLATFQGAAASAELVVHATGGASALAALGLAGAENLTGKILLDVANPLDFSQGFPPSLSVANTDSLGEQIQRAYPNARVVKALNTVAAEVMVDPRRLANGDHTMLLCGNDQAAKDQVAEHLRTWFGWQDVVDLGGIDNARGLEGHLLLWTRLYGVTQTPWFSIKLVR